jgi:hypothetical protein
VSAGEVPGRRRMSGEAPVAQPPVHRRPREKPGRAAPPVHRKPGTGLWPRRLAAGVPRSLAPDVIRRALNGRRMVPNCALTDSSTASWPPGCRRAQALLSEAVQARRAASYASTKSQSQKPGREGGRAQDDRVKAERGSAGCGNLVRLPRRCADTTPAGPPRRRDRCARRNRLGARGNPGGVPRSARSGSW